MASRPSSPTDLDFARRERCFVIAEIGINHNGDEALARRMIDAAHEAGADAVKFQVFHADRYYRADVKSGANSQREAVAKWELSEASWRRLAAHCRARGVVFFAAPFDLDAVSLLEALGTPLLKIASGEITHLALLERVAATRIPALVSTGMATLAEIERALSLLGWPDRDDLVLLQCTSAYPCPPDSVHLRAMSTLAKVFGLPVGLSDHSEGLTAALGARCRGAAVIEKHFTLDRALPGPDQAMSILPGELRALVDALSDLDRMQGDARKRCDEAERALRVFCRRGLVAGRALRKGDVIAAEDLIALRPADHIGAEHRGLVIGRTLSRDLAEGTPLTWEHLL